MNFGPEEREAYEAHLKWLRVEANTLKKYEAKGYDEGLEKGREEGEQIGAEKERQKNLEEKKNMVRLMLQENMNIETIAKITGLSIEEVGSLKS